MDKEKKKCLYNSLHLKYVFFESHGQIPQWIQLKIGHDYAVFLPYHHLILVI